MELKIKQIIPADNWWAIYEGDNGKLFVDPLCCFALDDNGEVFPMTAEVWVERAEEPTNYRGMVKAENEKEAVEKAEEWFREEPEPV